MDQILTERQAKVLALVVREHFETARAVSSLVIVRRYDVGVSGATVRHELAKLTEMGFLRQPHTSAGRVPTVEGYHYFVEHLMRHSGLAEAEKAAITHQFQRAGRDPERWMRLSAAVMAKCAGAAALVATPRRSPQPLRHLELVALDDGLVQVVAVMTDGAVRQWRWRPDHEVDQRALDRLGELVNTSVRSGHGLPAATGKDATPLESAGLELIGELMSQIQRPSEPQLYHAGLANMVDEPEFADTDRLHRVMELFEYGHGLERFLGLLAGAGVEVLMGGEPPFEGVPHVSFVVAPFGPPQHPGGVLGVVGPRRLPYERAVPAVQFVSGILTRLYAGEDA